MERPLRGAPRAEEENAPIREAARQPALTQHCPRLGDPAENQPHQLCPVVWKELLGFGHLLPSPVQPGPSELPLQAGKAPGAPASPVVDGFCHLGWGRGLAGSGVCRVCKLRVEEPSPQASVLSPPPSGLCSGSRTYWTGGRQHIWVPGRVHGPADTHSAGGSFRQGGLPPRCAPPNLAARHSFRDGKCSAPSGASM